MSRSTCSHLLPACLVVAAALATQAVRADDRRIFVPTSCKLEIVKTGMVTKPLTVVDLRGKAVDGSPLKKGDAIDLKVDRAEGTNFTLGFNGTGGVFSYDLKFTFPNNEKYVCTVESNLISDDKIKVSKDEWQVHTSRRDAVSTKVSTNPGTSLLSFRIKN